MLGNHGLRVSHFIAPSETDLLRDCFVGGRQRQIVELLLHQRKPCDLRAVASHLAVAPSNCPGHLSLVESAPSCRLGLHQAGSRIGTRYKWADS